MTIKTIDINAKTWFDKTYGNSYFAAIVTIDYSLPTEQTIKIPFTYGYGSYYEQKAKEVMQKMELMPANISLWEHCQNNGIVLRSHNQKNCLKRELKALTA
jgi:hypothetical protein